MNNYRFSPAARLDLSGIWDYTREWWDEHQAEVYLNEIRAAVERIADDPSRGRTCHEIREGYRRYSIGSHILFHRNSVDGVDVIRILHQAMDPTRYL